MTPTKLKSQAYDLIYIGTDELSLQLRRDSGGTLSEGFDSNALPAGWAWASNSTFVTPSSVDLTTTPSFMVLSHSAACRSFLYTTTIPATTTLPLLQCGWMLGGASTFIGLRVDAGSGDSDNNYFEWLLSGDLKGTMRTRVGGGAVATVQGAAMPIPQLYGVRMNRTGTKYSSWGANVYFANMWQGALIQQLQAASATTNASWTPTRFGIIFQADVAGYVGVIDGLYDL